MDQTGPLALAAGEVFSPRREEHKTWEGRRVLLSPKDKYIYEQQVGGTLLYGALEKNTVFV